MWRVPRKGTYIYDPKNRFSDYPWFYKFLNWSFMRCNQKFVFYIIFQDMNYWKSLECVRSDSSFFNRSPCKFSLLDRRFLFSDRVTHIHQSNLYILSLRIFYLTWIFFSTLAITKFRIIGCSTFDQHKTKVSTQMKIKNNQLFFSAREILTTEQ